MEVYRCVHNGCKWKCIGVFTMDVNGRCVHNGCKWKCIGVFIMDVNGRV